MAHETVVSISLPWNLHKWWWFLCVVFVVLVIWVVFIAVVVVVYPTSYKCKIFCIHMGSFTEIAEDVERTQSMSIVKSVSVRSSTAQGRISPAPASAAVCPCLYYAPLAFELKFGNLFFQFWLPCSKDSAVVGYIEAVHFRKRIL